jgi:hypothetical protein
MIAYLIFPDDKSSVEKPMNWIVKAGAFKSLFVNE